MRIAQIAPPWLPVPPDGYGGLEAVVGTLTEGLVDRGHEVTLFASAGSPRGARVHSHYDQPLGTTAAIENPLLTLPHVLEAYVRADDFDVVHDHTFPIGPSLGAVLRRTRVVHTLHSPPDDARMARYYEFLNGRVALVAVSESQRSSLPDIGFSAVIHNGISINDFVPGTRKDDYLLFVGRMAAKKGVHLAVEAATRLGRRLVIAAKMTDPAEVRYFDERVRPLMTDAVTFLGEVDYKTKVGLYQAAACTLAPMQWREPFGLVMIESMACGTPVVALRAGAAAEIIDHGGTGFLATDFDDFVRCIERADDIDPGACRRRVEERFSADRMVDAYERLFASVTA